MTSGKRTKGRDMSCSKCGAPQAEGAAFCSECGSAVAEAAPATPFCASCGTENLAEAAFCAKCGTSLKEGQAVDAVSQVGKVGAEVFAKAKEIALSESLRSNPWVSAFLGAMVAVIVGLLAASLTRAAVASELAKQLQPLGAELLSGIAVERILPNAAGFLMLMQGSEFNLGATGAMEEVAGGFDLAIRLPLTFMAVVPMLALFVGGWATAKYSRVKSVSEAAARGVMVAIPYAGLALLLSFSTKTSASIEVASVSTGVSSGKGWVSAVLTSLMLAVVFAPAGALLGARGRSAGKDALLTFKEKNLPFTSHALVAAKIFLAQIAVGLVVLVIVVAIVGSFAASGSSSVEVFSELQEASSSIGGFILVFIPMAIAMAVLLLNGASVVGMISLPVAGVDGGISWNLWSLIVWTRGVAFILLAIPIALLFFGGRSLAKRAGAVSLRSAVLEGVKLAVPYSAVMVLVAFFSMGRIDMSGEFFGFGSDLGTYYFGASVWNTSLVTFVVAALAGGAGGASLFWSELKEGASSTASTVAAASSADIKKKADAREAAVAIVAEQASTCPSCGTAGQADSVFCEECGTRLSTAS